MYQASVNDVDTTGIATGTYWVIVLTDVSDVVDEGPLEPNNTRGAKTATQIGIPDLTIGQVATGTFASGGTPHYYRVSPGPGEHLLVAIDDANDLGHNELYIKYGQLPTRTDYDVRYGANLSPDQQGEIPSTEAGIYYLMVYGEQVPHTPGDFTIAASLRDFVLFGISPNYGGNSGLATVSLRGARYDGSEVVHLLSQSGDEFSPEFKFFPSPARIDATFDLSDATPGLYDVRVARDGEPPIVLPDAFEVQVAQPPSLELAFDGPSTFRRGRPTQAFLRVTNTGNTTVRQARIDALITSQGIFASPVAAGWQYVPIDHPGLQESFSAHVWDIRPEETSLIPVEIAVHRSGPFFGVEADINFTAVAGSMPALEISPHADPYFDEYGTAPPLRLPDRWFSLPVPVRGQVMRARSTTGVTE